MNSGHSWRCFYRSCPGVVTGVDDLGEASERCSTGCSGFCARVLAGRISLSGSRRTRPATDGFKLGAWLEGEGVSARKKLHGLRKERGAVIANTLGIFAASRALRHADIRITSQYDADKKVRITTGLDSLLS